jgi:tRNA pseudouridine38-40 synthase
VARIAGQSATVTAAGRTDRGVHARGQVAHFDADALRPQSAWVRGVNAFLPDGVAVLWSREVPTEFHARYSAMARTYRYELLNRPVRPGLEAGRVGWFHAPLDVGAMREAAEALLGEHDFSAFRAAECQAKTPVRTIHTIEISRSQDRVDFVVKANAFLHHMVRNLVGSLVYVGCRRRPASWIAELLASRDRTRAAPTFGAEGLVLEKVDYDPVWGLPL